MCRVAGSDRWYKGVKMVVCLIVGDDGGKVLAVVDVEYGDGVL